LWFAKTVEDLVKNWYTSRYSTKNLYFISLYLRKISIFTDNILLNILYILLHNVLLHFSIALWNKKKKQWLTKKKSITYIFTCRLTYWENTVDSLKKNRSTKSIYFQWTMRSNISVYLYNGPNIIPYTSTGIQVSLYTIDDRFNFYSIIVL